jgi:succinate-acetate transporter protein
MDNHSDGNAEARAYLQPIAAPAILGLYGFAGATFMVSANIAGWYGTPDTLEYLAPFAATFGGLAQFLAGMWSFKARDPLASALLSMWGSYWIAFGILYVLDAAGTLTIPTGAFPAFGYWFIVLGAITAVGAVAATAENAGLVAILGTVALGCGCFAVGLLTGTSFWEVIAAYLFIIGALAAFYTASAMLFDGTFGRAVLPLGKTRQTKQKAGLSAGIGEPGVKHGQ